MEAEPAFVSALANRAAAHLAGGDAEAAVADCSAALGIFEGDEGGGARAAGPVPPVPRPRGTFLDPRREESCERQFVDVLDASRSRTAQT